MQTKVNKEETPMDESLENLDANFDGPSVTISFNRAGEILPALLSGGL